MPITDAEVPWKHVEVGEKPCWTNAKTKPVATIIKNNRFIAEICIINEQGEPIRSTVRFIQLK